MKKRLEKKLYSILVIALIYVIATMVAVYVYKKLNLNIYLNILIADVVATIVVYIFSVTFKNASVYDPYWSVQPPVIVSLYLVGKEINVSIILLLIAVWIWGIRLTLNWAYTFASLKTQDWRYTKYKNETGKFYQIVNFFGIHMMPTLLVYLATIPAIALINSNNFNIGSVIGFIVSICAVILQGAADYQMHRFRKRKTHTLIREGLWKYSRHPNYLGEILMWWGIAIQAISVTCKWWTLCGAICITILFLTISIPLADKRQSKKEGYERYKKETRCLIPLPKKIK